MCGLAGVARLGGGLLDAAQATLLRAMTRAVAHRGPDEQVCEVHGSVGLGFTRLALVAPEAGDQPFLTPDGRIASIVNGEVYNHRQLAAGLASGATMRTGSDCEVVGHLYQERGCHFLNDVNGMFAVAIHDVARRRLVLARDRFGIKPLYFHRDAERVVFASEIKALFHDARTPRGVDWAAALSHPMMSGSPLIADVRPITSFAGIEYVEPGTIVEIDLDTGRTTVHRYWALFGNQPELPDSDDELVEEYGRLLAESVADCAHADAELGLFLSGGVDSAAVAALAARTTDLHTFTLLSPATVESGDAYHADLVARRLGMPNHQVHVPHDHCPTPEEWLRFLWLMEHPMAGAEAYLKYQLHRYARSARPGLKGMLLGAASDEFNGGYSADIAGGGDWGAFVRHLSQLRRRGDEREAPQLADWTVATGHPVIRLGTRPNGFDDYQEYLRGEHRKVYQYNVWHEDRSAAGSGIEARVPFLDHRLVEFVTAVPPHRRERLLWDKQVLRRAVRGLLPPEIADREKIPFVHGAGAHHTHRLLTRMLQRDGGELVEMALSSPGAREHLDGSALRAAVREIGRDSDGVEVEFLLRLINLGLLDTMVSEPPPALVDTVAPAVLRVLPALDLSDEARPALMEKLLGQSPADPAAVAAWRDDVLVLAATDGSGRRFILAGGEIEYVVDDDNPAWFDVVAAIDGVRSLGDLLAAVPGGIGTIREELRVALDSGLLLLTASVPVRPSPAQAHLLDVR